MSTTAVTIVTWAIWLLLWAGLVAIFIIFADVPGHPPKHARPGRIVTATASVAAVISGWQPLIARPW